MPAKVSPPTVVATPAILGRPNIGEPLTCTMGEWTNEPTSYSYSWRRNGSSFGAADESFYHLVNADKGKTITCVVAATNADGSGVAPPSNAIGPIGDPLTGSSPDGQTLADEQRERSAAIEKMGVEDYKESIDERP